jgi:hypothetical protein
VAGFAFTGRMGLWRSSRQRGSTRVERAHGPDGREAFHVLHDAQGGFLADLSHRSVSGRCAERVGPDA